MGVLKGKTAVVTGAGRGIGKAIALGYAREEAALVCAARTLAEIESTAEQISQSGGKALAVQTDVTDPGSVQNLFSTANREYGGPDILVINAGIYGDHAPLAESSPEDWEAVLRVNLLGAYTCAREVIPYMKQRGAGKIITVGSGLGHRGVPGSSAYACSKAGLWMLTRVLAQELASDHISVNELIPGPVVTEGNPDSSTTLGSTEWVKQPEDVVPLAVFLAQQPDMGPTAQSYSLMRRAP